MQNQIDIYVDQFVNSKRVSPGKRVTKHNVVIISPQQHTIKPGNIPTTSELDN
jgi:hypothetical protein